MWWNGAQMVPWALAAMKPIRSGRLSTCPISVFLLGEKFRWGWRRGRGSQGLKPIRAKVGGLYYLKMDDIQQRLNDEEYIESRVEQAKGPSERAALLNTIGTLLMERATESGSEEDLDRSISASERALMISPECDENRARYVSDLAQTVYLRYRRFGSVADLSRAIALGEQLVAIMPKDNCLAALYLYRLNLYFSSRFERFGAQEDLIRAIRVINDALSLIPENHTNYSIYLSSLARLLKHMFENTAEIDHLNEAIVMYKKAISLITADRVPHAPVILNNLASSYWTRYEETGDIAGLHEAISSYERALALTPKTHYDHPMYACNLGMALRSRHQRTGSVADLDYAIELYKNAIAITPTNSPQLGHRLNSLNIALKCRFESSGSMDHLESAVELAEQVADLIPKDHPDYAMYLHSLGTTLRRRYEHTGSLVDLDRAIAIDEQVLSLTPEGHIHYGRRLHSLAIVLRCRFERIGSTDDLDRAIEAARSAVKLTPKGHPTLPRHLSNLASALWCRYTRAHSKDDLDSALSLSKEVVTLTPDGHPELIMYLNTLGKLFLSRFERYSSIEDLNEAISTTQQVVELAPEDSPFLHLYLDALGTALRYRFRKANSEHDLHNSIKAHDRGVSLAPPDHPLLTGQLTHLGISWQASFQLTHSETDLEHAISNFERAALVLTAPIMDRIDAAHRLGDLLIGKNIRRANSVLKVAVSLLQFISPRFLKETDQQYNISQAEGLAALAISCFLECDEEPGNVLPLLEQSRGIMENLKHEVRSDLSLLKTSHPSVAQEFEDIRYQLDYPRGKTCADIFSLMIDSSNSETQLALSKRFDNLLGSIRELPGFDRFLLGPTETEMMHMAEHGPIVVFNVSRVRSDAFIIEKNRIQSVRLPLLNVEDLVANCNTFLKSVRKVSLKTYADATLGLKSVLQWLWDVSVGPILATLNFVQTPSHGSPWPRVWWVPSGLLTLLPIHAAGYHDANPPRTALDVVVSSYTSTIKALGYARANLAASEFRAIENVLLVGMTETPGAAPLRYVDRELREVHDILSDKVCVTILRQPTTALVLSHLKTHQVVHFACHGSSCEDDPSQSKLLLDDWQIDPLTVSRLAAQNLQSARFAYLSACQTASSQNLSLLDEARHIASSIQQARYPSVIGTLWSVRDENSSIIAKYVHASMLSYGGGANLCTEKSAEALHHAVRKVRGETGVTARGKFSSDPLTWAPYMHIGV